MEYKRQQDVLNYEKLEDMLEGMPEFMRIFVDGCREDIMSSRSIIGVIRQIKRCALRQIIRRGFGA